METGERIGDYEILGLLGAGGMGEVYKVRNIISDRVEAMKVLLPNLEADAELLDRFQREIKVQASLEHPNIAVLRTAQRLGNQILMIMEYVEGASIESVLAGGPLPVEKAVDYTAQVLAALDYAHQRGVIHRDIKPANMMLTPGGTVKLMDFGIARLLADERLTQTGRTVGSLYYMSPEQIRGDADIDARADLYSLGVALYQMVTGKRPFEGDSAYSVMSAHLQQMPVPPIQMDPRVPTALNEIILMAIAKEPAKRFQSAGAMRSALLQGVKAPAPGLAPRPAPPRRRWLYVTLGSVGTLAVLVLVAIQLPRWRGTGAAAPPSSTIQPAAAPAPAPAPAPEADVAPAVRPSNRPPAKIGVSRPADSSPAQQQVQPPSQPQRTAPAAGAPAAQNPPAQAASAPAEQPHIDLASQKAIADARDRLFLMAARVNAVKDSMANLQRRQAAAGLGLRGDMVAANQRMEYQLDEADRAIKGGDPAAAKQRLDAAERELERLEGWLGR